jgi:E3 ubiquitin-protein transferase RMND5
MDALQIELAKLRRDANLTQSIQDVDKIIEQLEMARESIIAGTDALLYSLRRGG